MAEKVMSFNDFVIAPATRDDYRMNIWFMNKSEAVCRMKNADLSKKRTTMIIEILSFIVISNNMPEFTIEQQSIVKSG